MSYALPRTSLGPACFRTLTPLASEPRSWQLQALFVEFPELFDLFSNKARTSFACRCRARRNMCHGSFRQNMGKSPSVNTANAKGWTSNLLIDTVAFLELFNVRLERRENINI